MLELLNNYYAQGADQRLNCSFESHFPVEDTILGKAGDIHRIQLVS